MARDVAGRLSSLKGIIHLIEKVDGHAGKLEQKANQSDKLAENRYYEGGDHAFRVRVQLAKISY